jgi:uncharacterized protein YndB with AHSA1/START domain
MWKWVAVAVGVVVAAFFGIGVIVPHVSVTRSTMINRSPDVVWKVFTDTSRTKDWMTGLMSMETVSGAPMTVGSRHHLVFLERDRRVDMQETVTAVEPGRLYAFDSSMEQATGHTTVRLAPKDGGTEIAIASVYTGQSMLWRSVMVMVSSMIGEREGEDLAKLKALAEAEPAT